MRSIENNVVDLAEYAAQKAGIITPRRLINDTLAQANEFVALAVVGLKRDGSVMAGFTTAPAVTQLGLLEMAKDDVLNSIDDGEDD